MEKGKKKLKILMAIAQYYPVIGGAEIQAKRLSENLVKNGFSVSVFTVKKKSTLKSFEEINEVKVYRLRFFKIPKFGKYFLLRCEFFYLLFKGRNFDIFHCHQGLGFSSIAVLVAKILKKPSIVKISNTGERFDLKVLKKTYIIGFILSEIIKRADKIIYLSEKMKQELLRNGVKKEKLLKIPNGVDTKEFKIPEKEEKIKFKKLLGIGEDIPVIIYTGTIQKKKNLKILIKLAEAMKKEGKKYKVLIVGDGPERKTMEKEVREKELENFIVFTGRQKNVKSFLYASDIFVLPSFVEGLSNSLLEAASCGLPCVVSDIPGNREVVEDGRNGFLISPFDWKKFARAIEILIKNKSLMEKMGMESRKIIEERFSIEKVVEKYIQLYKQILHSKQLTSKIK